MDRIRVSSYIIPVKLNVQKDKFMLIHGYTGAMDIVSESLLSLLQGAEIDSIDKELVDYLVKRGYLTMKSKEEEHDYVYRLARALDKKYKALYSTFTWVITYNCNFRCPYCFEGRERKDGNQRYVFTKEQADTAFEAMELIQPVRELRRKTITLYGGEPLLLENKEIVKYIVTEGAKRGYKFIAITNGYCIDEFLDLFSGDLIYKLQITVDGPKQIHNVRRIHKDGVETFDKIISNIRLALLKNIEITVRMNVDAKNADLYYELKEYFRENGFFGFDKFNFYPAILENNANVTSLQKEELQFIDDRTFIQSQKDITQQVTNHYIYSTFIKALTEHKAISLRSVSCAAQVNGYVLDSLGGIYPCWDTIGDRNHLIGNYCKGSLKWNSPVVSVWHNTNIGEIAPCNRCKYALLCGGGCPYQHMSEKNLHCKMFKEVLEIALNKAYENSQAMFH